MTTDNVPQLAHSVNLCRIKNPLKFNEVDREVIPWCSDRTLLEYLPELSDHGVKHVVSINGRVVPESEYGLTFLSPGSYVVTVPVIEGGNSKDILRIVAMIAVSIVAPGWGGSIAQSLGFAAEGIAAKIITAGIVVAGGMLVNAILPPPKPRPLSDDLDQSLSYGIDGAKNVSTEGIPVPVIYGTYRMGGNLINLYVVNVDDTQLLYMLFNAGEGPISAITDILINEQPIANFADYEIQTRLGDASQALIPWFDDTISPVSVGQKVTTDWITFTTTQPIDKYRIDFLFPAGLFSIDGAGNMQSTSLTLNVEHSPAGANTWTPIDVSAIVAYYQTKYVVQTFTYWDDTTDAGGQRTYSGRTTIGTPPAKPTYGSSFDYSGSQILYLGMVVGYTEQVPVYTTSPFISARSNAPVRRSFTSQLLTEGLYDIRFRRTSTESNGTTLYNSVSVTDINEIKIEDVAYNNTALLGLKIRLSDQLNGLPKVTYLNHGRVIDIYMGDGQWTSFSSSNPAWIALDMIRSTRYGGGIDIARIDLEKWKDWGDYCDAEGLTFNGIIDAQTNMWDAMRPVFRAGHAEIIQVGTRYSVAIERADAPVMMFSGSNMTQDTFSISWLPMTERSNAIELTYFDKDDDYKRRTIKLYDESVPIGAEERVSNITMIGIVDKDRAAKEATLHLNLNKYITQTVEFEAPLDAIACTIGDLVYIQHDMPQWGFAGRLRTGSTTSVLELDRSVDMLAGFTYKALVHLSSVQRFTGTVEYILGNDVVLLGFNNSQSVDRLIVNGVDYEVLDQWEDTNNLGHYGVTLADATGIAPNDPYELWSVDVLEERDVVNVPGTTQQISLQSPLSVAPGQYANWMFGEVTKTQKPFRIRSIDTASDQTRKISAVEYNASVYDPSGAVMPTPNYSALIPTVEHVTIDTVTEELYLSINQIKTRVTVFFTSTNPLNYRHSEVFVSINGGPYELKGEGKDSFSFDASDGQVLSIRVVAIGLFLDRASDSTAPTVSHTVVGKTAPPGDVTNFTAVGVFGGIQLSWNPVTDLDLVGYEIREGPGWETDPNAPVGEQDPYPVTVVTQLATGTTFFVPRQQAGSFRFHIRAVDQLGLLSTNVTSADATLSLPPDVTGFDAIQNDRLVYMVWDSPGKNTNVEKFEIREGATWEGSKFVAHVYGTQHAIASDAVGTKVFWIRSISFVGLYSQNAVFSTTEVTAFSNRNLIIEQDEHALGYPGVRYKMVDNTPNLIVELGSNYSEYIVDVSLPALYTARNVLDYGYDVATGSVTTWDQATYTWNSLQANRKWSIEGDFDSVTVSPWIAWDNVPLAANEIDGWTFENSLDSVNAVSPVSSSGATYQQGRFTNGLALLDSVQVEYAVSIPDQFSQLFWVKPLEVSTEYDYTYFRLTGAGGTLSFGYSQALGGFFLRDDVGNIIVAPVSGVQDDNYMIAIVQTSTSRELKVANVDGQTTSFASQALTPVGAFTTAYLHAA